MREKTALEDSATSSLLRLDLRRPRGRSTSRSQPAPLRNTNEDLLLLLLPPRWKIHAICEIRRQRTRALEISSSLQPFEFPNFELGKIYLYVYTFTFRITVERFYRALEERKRDLARVDSNFQLLGTLA